MMGNYHVALLGKGDTVMYALLPSGKGAAMILADPTVL